jgi:hypothetical protein
LRVCWFWGAVSDDRTDQSFTIAAGPHQRSHSRVRVAWDSRPYFMVSDSRLPFSSSPTIRRATVEVVSQSVSLGVEPHLELTTSYLLLFDSYSLVFLGLPLWREDGSVFQIMLLSGQSYFTTDGLLPISSFWRRAPWDSRPEYIFSHLNTCGHSPYIISSLTRRWVCHMLLLLALASVFILGSEFRGTHDHILLSQIRDFPFCRRLQLAGLLWRYSTPPQPVKKSKLFRTDGSVGQSVLE